MSIENVSGQVPVRLDDFKALADLEKTLAAFEPQTTPIIYLEASAQSWDRVSSSLCSLRASNVAGILLLNGEGLAPDLQTRTRMLVFLRDWDQLFLHNIVVLGSDWIPMEFRKDFEFEVKMELKWFREWFMASHDQRISKYPGLPWRAFIRKIVSENYAFAEKLMALALDGSDEQGVELRNFLRSFLRSRKKAIALFPKKWSRLQ